MWRKPPHCVLTEETHDGAIYELAGGEALTQDEIAQILTQALNHPVRAEQESLDAWEARVRAAGLGEYPIDTLRRMFAYYEAYEFSGNSNVLSCCSADRRLGSSHSRSASMQACNLVEAATTCLTV